MQFVESGELWITEPQHILSQEDGRCVPFNMREQAKTERNMGTEIQLRQEGVLGGMGVGSEDDIWAMKIVGQFELMSLKEKKKGTRDSLRGGMVWEGGSRVGDIS